MRDTLSQVALVLGVNGQDGSFAAETLLQRGYAVYGTGRQEHPTWVERTEKFTYIRLDLRETQAIERLMDNLRPDLILHLAAAHTSSGFSEAPLADDFLSVNVLSLQAVLMAMVRQGGDARLVYAGSSHVFGLPPPEHVNLRSPRRPHNIYAVSKILAADLVESYRRKHGLPVSVLYFFNHESERRPGDFFIPRLISGLKKTLDQQDYVFKLASLDFQCDWGCAREYMDIAVDVATRSPGKDFLVATGRSVSGRELAERLFAEMGLDYRKHIITETSSSIGNPFFASLDELHSALGRTPVRTVFDVCHDMLAFCHQEKAA
ncbi:MAG: GDP-mannose 4,6-dehydratase [Alphaproteobacteria bacterium]|nr:GDP-mannose 4,6-dehydratase [Alphaproteobacteria bacterium]